MVVFRWKTIAGKAAFHAARSSFSGVGSLRYHGHDYAEIFWVNAGEGLHHINGRSVPLTPGSLVCIRPSDCHTIDPAGPAELKLTNVAFPRQTLEFLRPRYFAGRAWAFAGNRRDPLMRQLPSGALHRFDLWADELSRSPRRRIYLERFLLNVLTHLGLETERAPLAPAPGWLLRACRAIRQPEQFAGGVTRFLRLCGRSREHVARTMRRHFGITPTAYVNEIRMSHAIQKLEMGDDDIVDIALDCGIENLSHFYSLFRQRTGMSPRVYRLSHRRPI